MSKNEYAAAIVKARELGYTFKRNDLEVYDTYDSEDKWICFDYELPEYFRNNNIEF